MSPSTITARKKERKKERKREHSPQHLARVISRSTILQYAVLITCARILLVIPQTQLVRCMHDSQHQTRQKPTNHIPEPSVASKITHINHIHTHPLSIPCGANSAEFFPTFKLPCNLFHILSHRSFLTGIYLFSVNGRRTKT